MKAPVTMELWQDRNLMMGRRVGAWSTLIRGISLNEAMVIAQQRIWHDTLTISASQSKEPYSLSKYT